MDPLFLYLCLCVCLCYIVLSVHCSLVITCCERADLLALLCVMFSCVFVTFPYRVTGQYIYKMWLEVEYTNCRYTNGYKLCSSCFRFVFAMLLESLRVVSLTIIKLMLLNHFTLYTPLNNERAFVTFPYRVPSQVWYLIVLTPDVCLLPYFVM